MQVLARVNSFFRNLFRKQQVEQDLDEEIRSHLALMTEEKMREGMDAQEAVRAARVDLGGIEQVKEEVRAIRAGVRFETLLRDTRFALRILCKNPGFTTVAVLTLALGIGMNVAMFSIFNAFLFRLLPVKDPAQLTTLFVQMKGGGTSNGFSYPNFEDIQNQTTSVFSDVSPIQIGQADGFSVDGRNEPILTCYVAGNFFDMLGIPPALGRLILPSEGAVVGADPILVLGYSFWQNDFGGDLNVIGKRVAVNGHPVTIVGVAPRGFRGIVPFADVQGYLPLGMAAFKSGVNDNFGDRATGSFLLLARLRNGVNSQQAQRSLDVVAHRLSQQYPTFDPWESMHAPELGPLGPASGTNPVPIVAMLFLILAGLVLLLACMNVANLLLARATARRREMAVRAALGASRGRLIAQSLTEAIALALLGGSLGIVLGSWTSGALGSMPIQVLDMPLHFNFSFDWRVFTYALGAALVAGVFVGVTPALRASGSNFNDVLHESRRMTTEKRRRLRGGLVIAQVGGSLMLLIIAGLFVRSLANVQHADLGFDSDHVLNLSIDPDQAGYSDAQGQQLFQTMLERVRVLPGVESASLAATVPMGYVSLGAILQIEGYEPRAGERPPFAGENMVSASYFATMRIPVLLGRGILDADTGSSQSVAVINEAMAARFWPGQNPIGQHFTRTNFAHLPSGPPLEVVGVVGNSRTRQLSAPIDPYFYVPLAQNHMSSAILQIRAAAPLAVARGVLGIIHSLAPELPVSSVQTMSQALDTLNGLMLFRIGAALAASLGILGLLLAVVGVYGVVSYAASQRTHEIGIRGALGAEPKDILKMILRQGCVTVGGGLVVGIIASLAMARLVGHLLVGVTATDPLTYLSVSALLALVALAACYIPARRAMKVDPVIALRHE